MTLHIFGGGSGQLSAVRRCRSLGIISFVTDGNIKAPGCLEADHCAAASTFDVYATLRAVTAFQSDHFQKINALLVTGTDQPVLTAATVAARLQIPYFIDVEQALWVTNKKAMKNRLADCGIPSSPYSFIKHAFDDSELHPLHFPVVVKPLDSQGQRGVYRLETAADVHRRVDEVLSFSRQKEILVEEYYPSDEITLSGWLVDGRLFILSVTDRVTIDNPPSIGVCIAHHYPSKYSSRMSEIRQLTEGIIEAFRLKNGPVYFQYLIGHEDGRIIVNETACRLGGAYEDEFIPYITGVDILDVMIKLSCAMDYDCPALITRTALDLHPGRVVSLQMFFCSEGIIDSQTGMDELLTHSDIIGGGFLQRPGTGIRSRLNSTQRAGYFIVCTDSRDAADEIVEKVYSTLRINDTDGRNMIQFYDKMLFRGNK